MGQCWRFNWGAVLEYFRYADIETRQGEPLVGPCRDQRKTNRLQNVPVREKFGPQWRAAKSWEEEELAKALQAREIRTDLDRLMA